ncbi:rab-protein geranylgeranyltransferase [Schizopora paradoxa]|uniref:Geranylgeranyl transferase type-2 subunit alpha n=1 Tax=Schizopora paradoxa TaxID=27342 RepID=A0A0H2RQG9_9AGAM|nr:rab-protein geranylgeranyltransferase [Schizopora paradoxa]
MHGVRRARQTQEAIAAQKLKEKEKLQEYLSLTNDVLHRKKTNDFTQEALALTTRLLTANPEFYSIWNYRRDILTEGIFPQTSAKDVNDILLAELSLTMSFLRSHPKVYWIWNHRRWCLEHVPDDQGQQTIAWKQENWSKELYAVEKMLDADARNFHAWNYRRYVQASMPGKYSDADELKYTTKKIESNFSNFSAWHQRTKVLSSLWETGTLDMAASKDEEFELVKQALYVDPYDQSSWIYHRWLIGKGEDEGILKREIQVIEELSEVEPDCKWCLESLCHYKRLLLASFTHNEDQRIALVDACQSLLSRLQSIDPYRRNRYLELGEF